MLDTFAVSEAWRRRLDLAPFSDRLRARARAASDWLHHMIQPTSGDGPNVGANDGARLFPLTDTDYRDFRPSVQTAMALFHDRVAYAEAGPWDLPLAWLGIPRPEVAAPAPASRAFDDGGFAVLRRGSAFVLIRYPRYRFRPSQSDLLHLDLWLDGENLLRDAGTYSYAAPRCVLDRYSGTRGHNTVQFDDRDQMPRLGRFLFGDWPPTTLLEAPVERDGACYFAAAYVDDHGASHVRRVRLDDAALRVDDVIEGFARKAVLRWRLPPGPWRLDGTGVSDGRRGIKVEATVPLTRIELVTGWESRYYMAQAEIPVLEIEVHRPGRLTSHLSFVR